MKLLFFLILILGAGGSGLFMTYNSDRQISALKKNNRLLRTQLSNLRDKYNLIDMSRKEFTVEYLTVDDYYGLIPNNCDLRLYPSLDSPILHKTTMAMQVGILQKASVDNVIWYYIALPLTTNVNSRGWLDESSFSQLSNVPIES